MESRSAAESLTDRTSAVAMTICENKALTRRLLKREGFSVPEQVVLSRDANPEEIRSAAETQLKKWGSAVVKPLRGEQGAGITVDVSTPGEVERAFRFAAENGDEVVLEQYVGRISGLSSSTTPSWRPSSGPPPE